MDTPACPVCGTALPARAGRGRPATYCSTRCRVAAHRRGTLPPELAGRRWVRAAGKRPIRTDGTPASSTDPTTWSTFAQVRASSRGDGFGVMLGDGLGCYDLDHVTDEQAREFVRSIPETVVMAERSVSGAGVHVFVLAPESRGWRRVVDGVHVERYTRARFIRTTLDRISL